MEICLERHMKPYKVMNHLSYPCTKNLPDFELQDKSKHFHRIMYIGHSGLGRFPTIANIQNVSHIRCGVLQKTDVGHKNNVESSQDNKTASLS